MRTHHNHPARGIHPPARALAAPSDAPSAARLAAEAAFAAPTLRPAAAVPVRVLPVRRTLHAPQEPPAQQQAPAPAVAEGPALKTPRVFRLDDAQPRLQAPQDAAPLPAARRRRRTDLLAAKRPGPVLTVVANPAGVAAGGSTRPAPATALMELDQLRQALDALDPTFEQIRFAQAFCIDLPG